MFIGWKRLKDFLKKIVSASGEGLYSTPSTFGRTLVYMVQTTDGEPFLGCVPEIHYNPFIYIAKCQHSNEIRKCGFGWADLIKEVIFQSRDEALRADCGTRAIGLPLLVQIKNNLIKNSDRHNYKNTFPIPYARRNT